MTCFGLGWLPVAPGTWGSLPPAIAFGFVMYADVPKWIAAGIMAALMVIGCIACLACSPASIAVKKVNDPGEVVMDEFAAQAMTFLAVPLVVPRVMTGWESFLLAGFGFIAFRVFDIAKPWPIRRLERLPAGWGVLADDLVAGLGSSVFVYIVMRVLVRA